MNLKEFPANFLPQLLVDRNGNILKKNERFSRESFWKENAEHILQKNRKRIEESRYFSHREGDRLINVAVLPQGEERLLIFFCEDFFSLDRVSQAPFFLAPPEKKKNPFGSCRLSLIRKTLGGEHPVLAECIRWEMVGDLTFAVDPEEMLAAVLWLFAGFYFCYGSGVLCLRPSEKNGVCRLAVSFRREGKRMPLFPYEGELPLSPFFTAPAEQTEEGETVLFLPLERENDVSFFAGERELLSRVLRRLFPFSL